MLLADTSSPCMKQNLLLFCRDNFTGANSRVDKRYDVRHSFPTRRHFSFDLMMLLYSKAHVIYNL